VDGAAARGNERQTALVVRRLVERGHSVVASCRAGSETARLMASAGARVTGVRPRGDADLWNAGRFAHWLRREGVEALLLTSWKRAPIGAWAARLAGVERVVLRVGGTHRVPRGWTGMKHRWALSRGVHAVMANSRRVADAMLRAAPGLDPARVRVVPNGARRPKPAAPAPLRAELGIGEHALLAVTVGGLERRKGHHMLLEALAALGDSDLHLLAAGAGPERGALEAHAASLGIQDRAHWLGQRADVPRVLAASDLFVLASRSEGMAVAMLEAAAAGLPVVSTDVGGAHELLAPVEGRPAGGWIVPVGDHAETASALREVAASLRGDRAVVLSRTAEARWRLEHWFTVEHMIDGVEALLRGDLLP
jgi:glycosyltransferase involved in cell wall biosynthesis